MAVQQFHGDFIVKFLSELGAFERLAVQEKRETLANPMITVDICAKLGVLQGLALMYSLSASDRQCRRIIENCQNKGMHVTCGEMRDDLRELRRRFEDDFKSAYFLQLTTKQADQFQDPLKEWDFIRTRFSKVRFNVEESLKCFALERYGAAVFHILLVAEYGVIEVAKLIGVADARVPGWSDLDRIDRAHRKAWNEKSILERQHAALVEEFLPLALAVKNSWRHKISHVDKQIIWNDTDFREEVAGEIISATRGFMRKLALDLPK